MRNRLVIVAIAALAYLTAYLFGAFSYSRNLWPIELLRQIKDSAHVQAKDETDSLNQYDSLGRLTFHPYTQHVDCPVQAKTTGVLVNQTQQILDKGDSRLNIPSECYVASSPLLGGSGYRGEFITPLADHLIDKGIYEDIIMSSGFRVTLMPTSK
jgi:hypothetical protein